MDNPEDQIAEVIHNLTARSRKDQQQALREYFLPNAYFIHPFSRVPSFSTFKVPYTNQIVNSRRLVSLIYQWYRILSPEIKVEIDSICFDEKHCLLYATMRQTFTIWIVPFSLWQANVKLVTVLELQRLPVDQQNRPILNGRPGSDNDDLTLSKQLTKRYFIKGQEDHYQVEEFLKFIAPWGASLLWVAWQLYATFICAVGVFLCRKPMVVVRERILGLDSSAVKKEQ
ncbi:hypothetical protein F5Y06DRAFT_308577 [Hypoxylon sp. FL0890]|nr:hypothetical protein F5Y06DRAFT_308577 [Hypoxylon sp. FL0890]